MRKLTFIVELRSGFYKMSFNGIGARINAVTYNARFKYVQVYEVVPGGYVAPTCFDLSHFMVFSMVMISAARMQLHTHHYCSLALTGWGLNLASVQFFISVYNHDKHSREPPERGRHSISIAELNLEWENALNDRQQIIPCVNVNEKFKQYAFQWVVVLWRHWWLSYIRGK